MIETTAHIERTETPRVNDAALNINVSLGFTKFTFIYETIETIEHEQQNVIIDLAPFLRKVLMCLLYVILFLELLFYVLRSFVF